MKLISLKAAVIFIQVASGLKHLNMYSDDNCGNWIGQINDDTGAKGTFAPGTHSVMLVDCGKGLNMYGGYMFHYGSNHNGRWSAAYCSGPWSTCGGQNNKCIKLASGVGSWSARDCSG